MYRNWTHTKVNRVIAASGTALATNKDLWLNVIQILRVLPGVSVAGSSNSVTAGMDAVDRIGGTGDLVWANAGTAHSWIVFKFANMGNCQLLLSLEGASASGSTAVLYFVGDGGAFTGGTTLNRPTNANEQSVMTSATPLPAVDGTYTYHVPFTTDGSQFHIVLLRTGNVIGMASFGTYVRQPSTIADTATPYYALWSVQAASGAGNYANLGGAANVKYRYSTSLLASGFMSVEGWENPAGGTPAQLGGAAATGKSLLWPIGLANDAGATTRGKIGCVPDIAYVDAAVVQGGILTLADNERWASFDDIAIPWDATTPWITNSAPSETAVAGEFVMVLPPGGGGLRAYTTVGALHADVDEARWMPVHLEIDTVPGEGLTIVARQGADSAIALAAYSEALFGTASPYFGLNPLYQGKSSITIAGTDAGGKRYVIDLLPNGGWQREHVTLVPVIGREAV